MRVEQRIRPATLADGLAIVEMAHRFIASTPYAHTLQFNPDALADLVVDAIARGVIFLAEEERGSIAAGGEWTPVGMIAGTVEINPIDGSRLLSELVWWVNEEARSGRLAYNLLGSLEDWARQNACLCLKMVAPHQSTVGRFYERIGYSAVETAYVKRI